MDNLIPVKVHITNVTSAINKLRQDPNTPTKIRIIRASVNKGPFTIYLTSKQFSTLHNSINKFCIMNATPETFGDINNYETTLDTTTSTDLNQMLQGIKGFLGVFANDEFSPTFTKNIASVSSTPISAIINYDNKYDEGTHWIAIFIDITNKQTEYFDPFGVPPKKKILNALQTINYPIVMSNSQLQHINSNACGYYAVQYLIHRHKGVSIYDFIFNIFTKDPSKNEKILEKLVHS